MKGRSIQVLWQVLWLMLLMTLLLLLLLLLQRCEGLRPAAMVAAPTRVLRGLSLSRSLALPLPSSRSTGQRW